MAIRINIKNRKGSVLAFMLVIMTAITIILVSILQYISSQMRYGFHSYDREESLQIAESGINFYKWYLAKEMNTLTTPQEVLDYWNGDPIGIDYDCDETGAYISDYESGNVKGQYCIEVDPPDEWSTVFTVRSVGWTEGNSNLKRTIQARFRRPSFSEFMIVGDKQFTLNDQAEVHGRLHSNEGIHFNGVAYNTVSSEADTYYYSDALIPWGQWGWKNGVWTYWSGEYNNTLNKDVFQVGKQIGTSQGATHWDFPSVDPYINFARTKSLEGVSPPNTPCDSNGCYFNNTGEGRKITLNGGTFSACDVNSYCGNCKTINVDLGGYTFPFNLGCCQGTWILGVICTNYCNKYSIINYKRTDGTSGTCSSCSGQCAARGPYAIPNNGVIYVEDNVWLGGTLGASSNHKRVSILAADMSLNPGPSMFLGENNLTYSSYDGSDMLGLLGQNNVEIIKASQDNLRIDGALMARYGRVGRDLYYLDSRNSVTFYGSIMTNGKFNVGKGIIPTIDVGYQHSYLNFDNNLLYNPPPFFPTGVGYSMDSWEEL
ncbi:MAG TPA: pilus assembly PilX N-terminal domain-containing protein [Candidatus Moranbacteria bacterium]|nr:pilus assembly PilX N-terminal domain-containing protein [Candidatus Moranbacteria bacterium]